MTKLDILANTRSRYLESQPHQAVNEKHLCGLTLSRRANTSGGPTKKWWALFYVLSVLRICSLLPPFVGLKVLMWTVRSHNYNNTIHIHFKVFLNGLSQK